MNYTPKDKDGLGNGHLPWYLNMYSTTNASVQKILI